MDTPFLAQVAEVKHPYHVRPDSLGLVVLAPVHVGAACHAGGVEDVGGTDLVQL